MVQADRARRGIMNLRTAIIVAFATLALGAEPGATQELRLTEVVRGLDRPVSVFAPADGSGRIYVVEQPGRVRLVVGGTVRSTPALDLTSRVSCCGERGLLDFTLDPAFASNGRAWVNYTDTGGDTVIASFTTRPSDPDQFDPASERIILRIPQPFSNHNGGQLRFGPDGKLWIGTGDGGSGGDPGNRAQRLDTLLGKMLRLDVSTGDLAIPEDNPFAGSTSALPAIWSYGLRNPWRFSFDRRNGDLWIADVGQGSIEEVNRALAGSAGGENYGWRTMEGSACFNPASGCNRAGLVLPVVEYRHDEGCSVTGGFVYRGRSIRSLEGRYVFGDYCSGTIWVATEQPGGSWVRDVLIQTTFNISSFGEQSDGELLVLDYGGALYRLERVPERRRPVRR